MDWLLVAHLVALAVVAYLLGGMPSALIIGKIFYHVDVRQHGSGNLGATNVLRTLGAKAAIGTAVVDIGKGAAAVGLAMLFVSSGQFGLIAREWAMILAAICAVAGHSYSPYIRFAGGKGVATTGGALLVLSPWALPWIFALWLALLFSTRIMSLASILALAAYPLACALVYPRDWPRLIFALAVAAIVIWRHRSNIGRIFRGEENRISFKERGSVAKRMKGGS
ncbi:MAG: glycerol-3-phosphate 1-O-acyltransferase PlsY [Coriobacteriia bacterium]|nr:glycerol-3-phosphate 1-O-acyltransferase PlsY [Coriobacteriia bacterium]